MPKPLDEIISKHPWLAGELLLDKDYKRSDEGPGIKIIQEWLSYAGELITIDNSFGPATEKAVRSFQKKNGLAIDGTVGSMTFGKLIAPLLKALKPITSEVSSYAGAVTAFSKQHLALSPIEIGGDNCGPWVRLYMQGKEGPQWYWCAGFVCSMLREASFLPGFNMPVPATFSCDTLAQKAKSAGLFVSEKDLLKSDPKKKSINPGSIFLVRQAASDWVHTGIVTRFMPEYFETIEGNTNDDGSRNGYCVCKRTRGYAGKDFIKLA